jgi:hypothetical protein
LFSHWHIKRTNQSCATLSVAFHKLSFTIHIQPHLSVHRLGFFAFGLPLYRSRCCSIPFLPTRHISAQAVTASRISLLFPQVIHFAACLPHSLSLRSCPLLWSGLLLLVSRYDRRPSFAVTAGLTPQRVELTYSTTFVYCPFRGFRC